MIQPKRRKSKDNPYILSVDDKECNYFVSFLDYSGNYHKISIDKNIYDIFNRFELDDLSQLNEYDNHIEHLEITESILYKRALYRQNKVDDIALNKILVDMIKFQINKLPRIQRRRFVKYYFENRTFEEIATEEGCTKRAIKFSVDIALNKIIKNIQK